jgi:alginate O-acetyltransferase complex protein AlgI
MRDRDYEKAKPPTTYRYALLGASPEMGSGVADDQTFETLLEAFMNQENDGKGPYARYEILNFAVGNYSPLQQLWILEHKVLDFEPNTLLVASHSSDEEASIRHLVNRVRAGVDIPYDYLKEVLRIAAVDRNTPADIAEARLKPYGQDVLSWDYRRVVEVCRQRGIRPVWTYLPLPGMDIRKDSLATQTRLALDAGFVTIDLSDWAAHEDVKSLQEAEWDWHPNVNGHRLIAEKLYGALRERREIPNQQ